MERHAWIMLICCAIPLGLIVLLSALGFIGAWGFYALFLLCPLLHFVLMRHGYEHDKDAERQSAEKRPHPQN